MAYIKRISLLVFLTMLCGSCVGRMAETPDDFNLTLRWNTGALPPQYTYMYTVTIGPGQQGKLEYRPGYAPEDDSHLLVAEFTTGKVQMEALYQTLQDLDIFRSNWKKGEILLGSHGTSLSLTAFDKTYVVPSVSELDTDSRIQVETAMDAIRSLVPQALWEEMDARQAAYEAEYEE